MDYRWFTNGFFLIFNIRNLIMKPIIGVLLLASAVLCTTLISCSKDDNNTSQSTKEILLSKKWRVTSTVCDGQDIPLQDCLKDNFFVFKEDETFELHHGPIECNPNETGIDTGNPWKLSLDGKILTFLNADNTIESISSSVLKLKYVAFGGGNCIETFQGF
jgi:hypothetical protein